MDGAHCFTYGSLMYPDIMSRVAGLACRGRPALLADHARHPVRGEDYPGIVPVPGAHVVGMLYLDLPATAWPRLDAFEGDFYLRHRVVVRDEAGHAIEAWSYVFKAEHAHRLEAGEWDPAAFEASGKARFETRYLGFDQLPPEAD